MGDKEDMKFEKFSSYVEKIKKFFSATKNDEKSADLSTLDRKVFNGLDQGGFTELSKILENSELRAEDQKLRESLINTEPGQSSGGSLFSSSRFMMMFKPAVLTLVLTLSVSAIVTTLFIMQQDETLQTATQLEQSIPAPSIAMSPSDFTQSGYLAQDTQFKFEIAGMIKESDIKKSLKISPEVDFEVKVDQSGESQLITILPTQALNADQEYEVMLLNGTEFSNGSKLVKDMKWSFSTEPKFKITATTPRSGVDYMPVDSSIEFEFNHTDISTEKFAESLTITPNLDFEVIKVGNRMVVLPQDELESHIEYQIVVSGSLETESGHTLGEDFELKFVTSSQISNRVSSRLSLGQDARMINNTNKGIYTEVISQGRIKKVTFDLYKVSEADAVEIASDKNYIKTVPEGAQLVDSKSIGTVEYEVTEYEKADIANGVYLLHIHEDVLGYSIFQLFSKSDYFVIGANADDGFEGVVMDFRDESIVSSKEVRAYFEAEAVDVKNLGDSRFKVSQYDLVVAQIDGQTTFLGNANLNHYFSFWHENFGSAYKVFGQYNDYTFRNDKYFGMVYSDKAIYQAGEKINLTGFMREKLPNSDVVPSNGGELIIEFRELSYEPQQNSRLPISQLDLKVENGRFYGEMQIPTNISAQTLLGDIFYKGEYIDSITYTIGVFEKKTLDISLDVADRTLVNGDTMQATAIIKDFQGHLLPNKSVDVKIYRSRSHFDQYHMDSTFENRLQYKAVEDLVYDAKASTDSAGVVKINYKPVVPTDRSHQFYLYTVVVGSRQDDQFSEAFDNAVFAVNREIITARSTRVDKEGDNLEVKFFAKKAWSDENVSAEGVNIRLERTHFEQVEVGLVYDEETRSAIPRYENRPIREDVIATKRVNIGVGGHTEVLESAAYGSYQMHVDYKAVKSATMAYAYVPKEESQYGDYNDYFRLEIEDQFDGVVDGDVINAKLSYTKGAYAGVYFVANDIVHSFGKFESKDGKSVALDVAVNKEFYPAVTVCAARIAKSSSTVKSDGWESACELVNYTKNENEIKVTAQFNQESYQPGDTVKLRLKSTDIDGKPIPADIVLTVVDATMAEISSHLTVRSSDIARNFARFESAYAYLNFNGRIVYEEGGFGAGGGGEETENRIDDLDVAYWNPKLKTNGEGLLEVQFEAPSRLSTWDAHIFAVSDGNFGKAVFSMQAKLDRFIGINTPLFMRDGDSADLDLMLTNFQDAVDSKLEVSCEGCAESPQLAETELNVPANTQRKVALNIKAGNEEDLKLVVTWRDSEGNRIDSLEKNIKIYKSGVMSTLYNSEFISENQKSKEIEVDFGDSFDKSKNSMKINVGSNIDLNLYNNPVNSSDRTTPALANSILFELLTLDAQVDSSQDSVTREKISQLLSLLMQNQDQRVGGFAWNSYDSVELDSSVMAAVAIGKAETKGIGSVSTAQKHALERYLVSILMDVDQSSYAKAKAINGLSTLNKDLTRAMLVNLSQDDSYEELIRKPHFAALIMQSYNNIGSTGKSHEIFAALSTESMNESDATLHWDAYSDSTTEEISALTVTSNMYSAISPIEAWHVKFKIRNWLVTQEYNLSSQKDTWFRNVYILRESELENQYRNEVDSLVTLFVNDKEVREFTLKQESFELTVDSKYLQKGKNIIRLEREGKGAIYISVLAQDIADVVDDARNNFEIKQSYLDLHTRKPIDSADIAISQPVIKRIEVTPTGEVGQFVVKDSYGSGLQPVPYNISGFSDDLFIPLFRGTQESRFLLGSSVQDFTMFAVYSAKAGETYTFEYILLPTHRGDYNGGHVSVYQSGNSDISGVFEKVGIQIR